MSDESKLPKWARDELTKLRGQVSHLTPLAGDEDDIIPF